MIKLPLKRAETQIRGLHLNDAASASDASQSTIDAHRGRH
jgi:hypothetical protein